MTRHLTILVAALLVSLNASAATCRSQTAAMAGSHTGYSRDEDAATRVEQKESESSDAVGRCISGITTITVMPTFPSLSDIFDSVLTRACTVAIDRIRNPGGSGSVAMPGWPSWPSLSSSPAVPGGPSAPTSPTYSGGTPPFVPGTPASAAPATPSALLRAIWH